MPNKKVSPNEIKIHVGQESRKEGNMGNGKKQLIMSKLHPKDMTQNQRLAQKDLLQKKLAELRLAKKAAAAKSNNECFLMDA